MEANVEVVRRMIEAIGSYFRAEGSWHELVAPFLEPDVDYYPVRKWPESRPCHGIEELARFMAQWNEAWEAASWEILEIEAVGDDRVLMLARFTLEGRGSGLGMSGDVHFCYWLRHGRIFRQEDHLTEAGARRSLGLEG